MVNVVLLILVALCVLLLLIVVLTTVYLLQLRGNSNYTTSSTLRTSAQVCAAVLVFAVLDLVLYILATVFLFMNNMARNNLITLICTSNIVLSVGVWILCTLLLLDNRVTLSIILFVLSLFVLILSIVAFVQLRHVAVVAINKATEAAVAATAAANTTGPEVVYVLPPPPPLPEVYTNELRTTFTPTYELQ